MYDIRKYDAGFSVEFAWAVNWGIIQEPFCIDEVRQFAEPKGWKPSEKYLNVVLPNGASESHSPTYKKLFVSVGNGKYVLSDLGKQVYLN